MVWAWPNGGTLEQPAGSIRAGHPGGRSLASLGTQPRGAGMLEWGSLVVRHQGRAVLGGHLRDKRGELGSMREEPQQGKNFISDGSLVMELLGTIAKAAGW